MKHKIIFCSKNLADNHVSLSAGKKAGCWEKKATECRRLIPIAVTKVRPQFSAARV
jgi:hypothetical protein